MFESQDLNYSYQIVIRAVASANIFTLQKKKSKFCISLNIHGKGCGVAISPDLFPYVDTTYNRLGGDMSSE